MKKMNRVIMAHGGGGELTAKLLAEHVFPFIHNPKLDRFDDGANIGMLEGAIVLSTDSFVIDPIVFPGGNIGDLAVCGTVNDLVMMGAHPVALSLSLILQEGLSFETLDLVMRSLGKTARKGNVEIVTGDTKVIESPQPSGGIIINTTGIGRLRPNLNLGLAQVKAGDKILLTGSIAEHGLAIMSARQHLGLETTLQSDTANLSSLIHMLLDEFGDQVRFLRDPTRGGVSGVACDIVEKTGFSIVIDESAIPISKTAQQTAALLGLDPLDVANEGKALIVIAPEVAKDAVMLLRSHELGRSAECIGRVENSDYPLAELKTRIGGRSIIQRPYGELLPRIC